MTLTDEQKITLNTEILNDPKAKGYATFLPDQPWEVVAMLNARTEQVLGTINRTDLTKWAAKTGMRAVVEDEARDPASQLRSLALSIIDVLHGSSGGIDFTDQDNVDSLVAWVALGKLTTENRDLMLEMATSEGSRAEALKLPYMTNKLFVSRQ